MPYKGVQINVQKMTTAMLAAALRHVCDVIIASEPMLTELDTRVGDGDHGEGMKDGFTELKEVLDNNAFDTLQELTRTAGMALVKAMGGASGVIFGTMFIGGHEALTTEDGVQLTAMDGRTMRRFFRLSAEAIAKRGHTRPNDRTMLDALLYAVDAMEKSASDDVVELLRCAWDGASRGAEATSQMRPRLGRAKNFREQAIGCPDPGAVSTSLIFRGLYEEIGKTELQTNQ